MRSNPPMGVGWVCGDLDKNRIWPGDQEEEEDHYLKAVDGQQAQGRLTHHPQVIAHPHVLGHHVHHLAQQQRDVDVEHGRPEGKLAGGKEKDLEKHTAGGC